MEKFITGYHLFIAAALLLLLSNTVRLSAQSKSDFTTMREKILTAESNGKTRLADSIANVYIDGCLMKLEEKNLFTQENLSFIGKHLGSSGAFKIFKDRSRVIDSIMGFYYSEYKIMDFIDKYYLPHRLNWKQNAPNWIELEKTVTNKFGVLGQEVVLGQAMFYYLDLQDWKNYSLYYFNYFKIAFKHPRYYVNNFSWAIFEHVNDFKILLFATDVVMKYAMEEWYKNEVEAYDTYSNLLYKIGRKEQAVEWQSKAVKLSNNGKIYIENLEKMQKGEKTW